MLVTYAEVQKARSEAIRLGVIWASNNDASNWARHVAYCNAWDRYAELDREFAELEIATAKENI